MNHISKVPWPCNADDMMATCRKMGSLLMCWQGSRSSMIRKLGAREQNPEKLLQATKKLINRRGKRKANDTMLMAPRRKRIIFSPKDKKEFHLFCATS